jgi:hypothetical protein
MGKGMIIKSLMHHRRDGFEGTLDDELLESARASIDQIARDLHEQLRYGRLTRTPISSAIHQGSLPNGQMMRFAVAVVAYPTDEEASVPEGVADTLRKMITEFNRSD